MADPLHLGVRARRHGPVHTALPSEWSAARQTAWSAGAIINGRKHDAKVTVPDA